MTEDIDRIIRCLALSVQDNEIKSLESLSWAINKLENFSMTFETLDKYRIGQTLQSVRHSKKISSDISGRIRNLIKCWRQLLNVDCIAVTPNKMKTNLKSPHEMNGVKNGIIKEKNTFDHGIPNGINHDSSTVIENDSNYFKPKKKPDKDIIINDRESDLCKENNTDLEIMDKINESNIIDECQSLNSHATNVNIDIVQSQPIPEKIDTNAPDESLGNVSEIPKMSIDPEKVCPTNQCQPCNIDDQKINSTSQLGKPKLKSTKELLADFSSLIDADTKNKILMNEITQEDDDPTSYHPEEFKLREMIQQTLLYQEIVPKTRHVVETVIEPVQREDEIKESKCDKLLRKFNAMCTLQPAVVFQQMVPWKNMKRGIDCSAPCIKPPKSLKRFILQNGELSTGERPNKYSISEIDGLLQSFEMRAQRKDMITEAISQRKECQPIDNTQSIENLSIKLTLKLQQPKLPTLKLKKRKVKRKKKRKLKRKPPPPPRVKKPRKPRIKPKPPITNYLSDMPQLPELTEDLLVLNESPENRNQFHYSEENVIRFTNDQVEGYNCTKHTQTLELLDFTKMYSVLIDKKYLHVFPWVDLNYSTKPIFSSESDQIIQSALDLPPTFS